jgi:hypothetical protein
MARQKGAARLARLAAERMADETRMLDMLLEMCRLAGGDCTQITLCVGSACTCVGTGCQNGITLSSTAGSGGATGSVSTSSS